MDTSQGAFYSEYPPKTRDEDKKMGRFSIKVYKEYFNFACAHFMMFTDGGREPLHGHNYRVRLQGHGPSLEGDVVFDFLHIKPIVKEICDVLDHKLILPEKAPGLSFEDDGAQNVKILTKDSSFSIPRADIAFVPIANTSVELIAAYFAEEIQKRALDSHGFRFSSLEVEVEESPGQSAVFATPSCEKGDF
ncbi:MAG: 6-carboxytetrahydropterin synthase [Bacteriovoracales bacterium]|nr:6-carboxytetrahydropterin synthase [Bacteriovoracales bacterium]